MSIIQMPDIPMPLFRYWLKCFRNKHCVRKTPLYHNATLEAPDGALLCVCDIKKARWYIEKELGVLVQEEPLRVRLNFEPSGRPEGPAGTIGA